MIKDATLIHATTVYLDGYGVIISGASGIGKSSMAVELLSEAHGFDFILLNSGNNILVADDQTQIVRTDVGGQKQILAYCPKNIQGLLEIRGLGIISVPFKSPVTVHLYVEIVNRMPPRMPAKQMQKITVLDVKIPYIQIFKDDRMPNARIRAALYAHTRKKLVS